MKRLLIIAVLIGSLGAILPCSALANPILPQLDLFEATQIVVMGAASVQSDSFIGGERLVLNTGRFNIDDTSQLAIGNGTLSITGAPVNLTSNSSIEYTIVYHAPAAPGTQPADPPFPPIDFTVLGNAFSLQVNTLTFDSAFWGIEVCSGGTEDTCSKTVGSGGLQPLHSGINTLPFLFCGAPFVPCTLNDPPASVDLTEITRLVVTIRGELTAPIGDLLPATLTVTNLAVIPEPSTLLLLGTGLAGLVAWRRTKAS